MSDDWVRRMKTYFHRIDFDKDGSITQKDFEAMGDRFVESEKLDAARGQELRKKLLQVWETFLKGVASDGTKLTEGVFVEAMKKKLNDPNLGKVVGGPLPLFFSAVDANGDGQIQEDEYSLFFQILGLDPGLAPASFKAIDTNNDGQLSLDEFVEAGTKFFTDQGDKGPARVFWGPLI